MHSFTRAWPSPMPRALGSTNRSPKFGSLWLIGMFDQKYMPHALTSGVGNPAAFALWIEICDEVCYDAGDKRFERFVPAVLLGICCAFPMYDPAHITRAMWPEHIRRALWFGFRQDLFYGPHRI